MRLSDGVEWGIHCAAVLASLPDGAALSAHDLATFHGVSESYLLKHLKKMAKAGILQSVPGPQGGYRLNKPAHEVTILAIVESIEGTFTPFRCTEIRKRGPVAGEDGEYRLPCQVHALMLEAQRAYREVLKRATLADLTAKVAATVPAHRLEKAEQWFGRHVRMAAKEKMQ